jgi:hypothetical protein
MVANGKLYAKCGISGDAFLSPGKNLAKPTKLRHQAEYPHFVYSMLCTGGYCCHSYYLQKFAAFFFSLCAGAGILFGKFWLVCLPAGLANVYDCEAWAIHSMFFQIFP